MGDGLTRRIDLHDNLIAELDGYKSHQADNLYQTAGGTGTAITLTINGALVTGYPITFIASANNNSSATTINGKPLYKPGTTAAPTLRTGKAYTVWYNSSGNCFFIKASATGTVTSDKVLAGETYSTEVDTDLVGTMPNLIGVRMATGVSKWGEGALAVYPEKGYQKGGAGDGEIKVSVAQLQSVEGNLMPSNILSGKFIFGVGGTAKRTAIGTYTKSSYFTITLPAFGFTPSYLVCWSTTADSTTGPYVIVYDTRKSTTTVLYADQNTNNLFTMPINNGTYYINSSGAYINTKDNGIYNTGCWFAME